MATTRKPTLREQVADLESKLDEARKAQTATLTEARKIIDEAREKKDAEIRRARIDLDQATQERDWLRGVLADIVSRVSGVQPAERPPVDQYGNTVYR